MFLQLCPKYFMHLNGSDIHCTHSALHSNKEETQKCFERYKEYSAHILPIDIFLLFLCVFCIHILFRTSFYFASVHLINVCNNLYAWSNFDLDWCIQWTVFALVYACFIILNNIQPKKLSYYWKCIKYFFFIDPSHQYMYRFEKPYRCLNSISYEWHVK